MCTVILLRRPGHRWPLLLAANRDEMAGRPWRPPARHWGERAFVVAGRDELAGGTWLGLNDDGVVAAVLNRPGTLGPAAGRRSRGELPLEALDHAEAAAAAAALGHLDPRAYRPFNMVVADARGAWWLSSPGGCPVRVEPVPDGVSMITAHDLNDGAASARIRFNLPRLRAAPAPDPGLGDWFAWQVLLASSDGGPGGGPEAAMCVRRENGFGTSSSSLIGLPARGAGRTGPVWLFAAGPPDVTPFEPVAG